MQKGGPSGLLNIQLVSKYQKSEGAGPLETFQNFQKSHMVEKNYRGTLRSRPVLYITFKK